MSTQLGTDGLVRPPLLSSSTYSTSPAYSTPHNYKHTPNARAKTRSSPLLWRVSCVLRAAPRSIVSVAPLPCLPFSPTEALACRTIPLARGEPVDSRRSAVYGRRIIKAACQTLRSLPTRPPLLACLVSYPNLQRLLGVSGFAPPPRLWPTPSDAPSDLRKLQVKQLTASTVVAGAPAGRGDATRLSWVLDRRAVMPELLPSARITFRRLVRVCVATLPTVLYGHSCRVCVIRTLGPHGTATASHAPSNIRGVAVMLSAANGIAHTEPSIRAPRMRSMSLLTDN